ncbi:MAG: toll/interleukin-1 receptor domain-containing protein [Flavobacteriaceae bacterium]|nr:toll/interleukin-1 receptor domain-containing protein [Flavobacteriaceae bacterium]
MSNQTIFISYAHANSEDVLEIIKKLTDAGLTIWYDAFIKPGSDWDTSIENAINSADVVLVFLSKAAIESKNVKQEYSFAIDEHKTIIPIFLESVEAPFRLRLNQSFYFTENKNLAIQNLILRLQSPDGVYKAKQASALSKLISKLKASIRYVVGVLVLFLLLIIYLVFFTEDTATDEPTQSVETTQTEELAVENWETTTSEDTVDAYYDYIINRGVSDVHFEAALDSINLFFTHEGYVEYRNQNDVFSFYRAVFLEDYQYFIGEDYKKPEGGDLLVALNSKNVYMVVDGQYVTMHDEIISVDQIVRVIEVLKYTDSAAIWLKVAYAK